MHRFIIILLVCLSAAFPAIAVQESNPFVEMIGKAYGECFERYEAISDSLFFGESNCRSRLVQLLAEAAQADASGEWELNRRMAECHVRFYDSRDGGFIPTEEYTTEQFAQDLLAVAREAQDKGFLYVRLRALFKAGMHIGFSCRSMKARLLVIWKWHQCSTPFPSANFRGSYTCIKR